MTFESDIADFCKKAGESCDNFVLTFTQDLAEAVVENTPVQTGFLRSSWTAAINAPDATAKGIEGTLSNPSDPSPAFARIALNLSAVKAGQTVYINNNASYGPHVEFGTSKMSPRAFVRGVIARASSIAEAALQKVKSKNG